MDPNSKQASQETYDRWMRSFVLADAIVGLLSEEERKLIEQKSAEESPSVDELMPHIDRILHQLDRWFVFKQQNLRDILHQRGRQYGEEVLMVMGEQGMYEMMRVKMHRVKGSMDDGQTLEQRHDSWIDIAGYALLILATESWKVQHDIDGVQTPNREVQG